MLFFSWYAFYTVRKKGPGCMFIWYKHLFKMILLKVVFELYVVELYTTHYKSLQHVYKFEMMNTFSL